MPKSIRRTFLLTLILHTVHGWAQPRAAECFFIADFESEEPLNGWALGDLVERQDPLGTGSGMFTSPWVVGDAQQANAAGYFPVVDVPAGDHFVMANDAAPPCNCAMSDVMITTPVIDLSDRTGVALECRVFHEGNAGAGAARIEVNVEGDTWLTVADLQTFLGDWQDVHVDLSTFDGAPALRIRFRWSDGDTWSSGFALDDVCLRERTPNDLSVLRVRAHDERADPFESGHSGLYYRQLPLEQASPVITSLAVKNSGTTVQRMIQASVMIGLNGTDHGPFLTPILDSLAPGSTSILLANTGWMPDNTGTMTVTAVVSDQDPDDDAVDNTGTCTLQLTGPGWDAGYSVMSADDEPPTSFIGGTNGFIASTRMEIVNTGSSAYGISVRFDGATEEGGLVRAILMDSLFNLVDTSERRTITSADLGGIWNGLPQYFALSDPTELGIGDYFVGIQHLTDDDDRRVVIATGGVCPSGRAVEQTGPGFTVNYPRKAPMVRLHLSEVPVSLPSTPLASRTLVLHPVPASEEVRFQSPEHGYWTASLVDAMGRTVLTLTSAGHEHATVRIPVGKVPDGTYAFLLTGTTGTWTSRLVVAH